MGIDAKPLSHTQFVEKLRSYSETNIADMQ